MPKKVLFKGVTIRNTKIIGGGDVVPMSNASGIVADGYIKSAQINIINALTGEVVGTTYTDSTGAYSIDIVNLPEFVIIESLGGVDISTNKPFTGRLKAVRSKAKISQPTAVTPLTTIVTEKATTGAQISDESIETSTTAVAQGLGIEPGDVTVDFLAENNTQVAKKAAQVSTVIKTITTKVGDDELQANTLAIAALTEKITGQLSFGLESVDNIKAIVTLAADKSGDQEIIDQTLQQADTLASTATIVNQTINDIDVFESATVALETIAKLNAATEEILTQPLEVLYDYTPQDLQQAISDVEVFEIYQPVITDPPSPPYTPWTKPDWPPLEGMAICAGDTYITVNTLTNWSVYVGQFEPFFLSDGVLKRLKNISTGTAQSSDGILPDTTYVVSITGAGRYTLQGAEGVTWSTGDTQNYIDLDNNSVNVTMTTPATGVLLNLMTESQSISAVSMRSPGGVELLSNNSFNAYESDFYELEGWYLDQDDPYSVSPWSLGWVDGFNQSIKETLFRDPVFIAEQLLPVGDLTYNITNITYEMSSILQPVTGIDTSITYQALPEPGPTLPTTLQVEVYSWDPAFGGAYNLVDDVYVRVDGDLIYSIMWSGNNWVLEENSSGYRFPGPDTMNDPTGDYDNKFTVTSA